MDLHELFYKTKNLIHLINTDLVCTQKFYHILFVKFPEKN